MQKKHKRASKAATDLRKPILIIRWGGKSGKSGMREAEDVRDEFPCDTGLQFAEFRDKKEVKEAIHAWLTNPDHPDDQVAQNLYIGSHGNKLGLFPTTRSKRSEVLTWAELASVINPPKRPIVLWLGACESSYAAEAWSQPGMNVPVQLIVGFSGEPDDNAVTALLLQLVHMSNIKTRGRKPRRKPLTYLPADVRRLKRMKFKKSVVTVHYKFEDRPQPEYVEVSKFRSRVRMGFGKYLDKRNIPVPKLFDEALNSSLWKSRPKAEVKALSPSSPCDAESSATK